MRKIIIIKTTTSQVPFFIFRIFYLNLIFFFFKYNNIVMSPLFVRGSTHQTILKLHAHKMQYNYKP